MFGVSTSQLYRLYILKFSYDVNVFRKIFVKIKLYDLNMFSDLVGINDFFIKLNLKFFFTHFIMDVTKLKIKLLKTSVNKLQ